MTIAVNRPDPGDAQRRAANPVSSVWVSASAGTGKTKVLTDRVLSLLLSGTAPHKILCLTFTRAAAAEMANRVNRSLAEWAVVKDDKLRESITDLTGAPPDDDAMARARMLFAEVLETPGGLKIQTIHAFCESLLGRFPLEANLEPHFQLMDQRTATEAQAEARDRVLARARIGGDDRLAAALAEVTAHVHEQDFLDLMGGLSSSRGAIRGLIERHGGIDGLGQAVHDRFGVDPAATVDGLSLAASDEGAFDQSGLRRAAAAMIQGSKTDQVRGQLIADWLAAAALERAQAIGAYLTVFFTQAGEERKKLINKDAAAIDPAAPDALSAEAGRLADLQARIRAVIVVRATVALLRLGNALLAEYERIKRERARLDYDDLILKARALLDEGRGTPWVMYKLDEGIDHVLIDEAQDTNRDQWDIVRFLTHEFFVGDGAREAARTVFAVGDPKQSIYSFQGAEPLAFANMRDLFHRNAREAGRAWDDVALDISFRSTESVLGAVDSVFAGDEARSGVVEPDAVLRHDVWRQQQAGLVELWPTVAPDDEEDLSPWTPPVVARGGNAPTIRLANVIAGRIRRWLDEGEMLKSRGRPVRPGDIMVLVRRRGPFVEALVRALKGLNVPVAGVDRMRLNDQLAIRDLIALGQFLLLPEDDLTLAVVLKGPLFGLDDEALFTLAHNRGQQTLWRALRERSSHQPDFAVAARELSELLARADFAPPFELFADVLARRKGRQKTVERLGRDANDPIDEFLAAAFEFERESAPSLQSFLHWLVAGDIEIKRDLEQAVHDEVRVMTVHGAKGLQAPIVFMPDTMQKPSQPERLLWTDDGMMVWLPKTGLGKSVCDQAIEESRRRRDDEYRRLLYVSMTRAEDRLYVCGWETRRTAPNGAWYHLVASAMAATAERLEFDFTLDSPTSGWQGGGWRLGNDQAADPEPSRLEHALAPKPRALPDWARQPPPPEGRPPRPLVPSRPDDDEPPLRSPAGGGRQSGFRRGILVHRVLQFLPTLAVEERGAAVRRYLARPVHDLSPDAQEALAEEVLGVVDLPEFAALFGPGSRAEVPIAGLIGSQAVSGQVDRLVVTAEEVLIVDYKTNRPPPVGPESVPRIYQRQMAVYREILRKIYPGRRVRCALLWTDAPRLMGLSDDALDSAIATVLVRD
ncbi:MAG: ATP-dependent helicase/nuclease subunit A [Alphaproteobacteria bacterium]|jgi:ATP-dependent helicase/nuclease subunit A